MSLNHLIASWVKVQYSFLLHLDPPHINSLAAVSRFLAERRVQIEFIQVEIKDAGVAVMLLRCYLEKDRGKHTTRLLGLVKGVVKLETIE